ncbi:unnamed protein product [Didymodactylos carnosus]|uniref:Uncharacterized protein n=1 Tax=Didymodactylos carnosus TaxID=1234261 RepID=A0A8S2RRZ9_9BILA|nr:unnamed protein product [Didymodactylos carnosus]CAF4166499.1 unnamed protein product [Didymodactylos carnosus]
MGGNDGSNSEDELYWDITDNPRPIDLITYVNYLDPFNAYPLSNRPHMNWRVKYYQKPCRENIDLVHDE